MELKTYFAQDASGNIMPGATVTVYLANTTTLATGLQDESGDPLANPFTADSSAKVAFYAPDGLYDITVVGNGRTVTIRAQFVSVDGASVLRSDLAAPGGAALVGFQLSATGAAARTAASKLMERVSVKDFGAVGNWNGTTGADDTAAIQAAFVACPPGGEVIFPTSAGERYRITDEIRVTKPVTVRGSCGNVYGNYTASSFDSFAGVEQTNTAKAAFKLVASLENYAFNQYGILGVHFKDLMISGPSGVSYASAAITTDTTVNGGDYHIRHCSTENVAVRYFTDGVDFTGIAYLNNFYNSLAYNCTTGWKIAKGTASDSGGQTRWFGCSGIACDTAASLNEGGSAGSFAFFGCTLSEGRYGIRAYEECSLTVIGCEFESLQNAGNGAGIYIEIKEANPNSGAAKTIVGNKFLNSDADIWINKTTTTYSGGGFAWPMLLDGNTLNSAAALKITVPSGHTGIDSKQFVFGASNAGPTGPVAPSQISANFLGYDARTWAAKVAPTGAVVGTTDTQTLSNKTFSQNTLAQTSAAFSDATQTVSTGSGTTGNFARRRFAENSSGTVLGDITVYGSTYGGTPSRNYAMTFGTQGVERIWLNSAEFRPLSDNVLSLGVAANRWSVVYAGTGTISTSDEREKQQIRELSEAERAVAVRLKGLIRAFKFNDAVTQKGEEARTHFGVIAQDVQAAFEAEGLDAFAYAVLCFDEWGEVQEVRDEEGNIVQESRPAGNRYGVRYEELLAFIISAL